MTHIEKDTLRRLHRPGWGGTWVVLGHYVALTALCLAGGWAISERVHLLAGVAGLGIAYVMHAFLVAFHEAAHDSLCPWPPLNEYFVRVIGLFGFMSPTLYRAVHHWHHAHLGTAKDEEFWPFSDPATSRRTRRLMAASELTVGILHTPLLFLRAFARPGSRVTQRRALIWVEAVAPWLIWTAVGVWCVANGWGAYYLGLFVLPGILAGNIQSLRKFVEHIGLTGRGWAALTRAVRPKDVAGRALSASLFHEPYHDLHHRYPKIPQEALPAAATVDPSDGQTFPTYRAAFRHFVRCLPDPKFGPGWVEPERLGTMREAVTSGAS
jgi:fatty acid desaturase